MKTDNTAREITLATQLQSKKLVDDLTPKQIENLNRFIKLAFNDESRLHELRKKSNAEIAVLLIEHVWSQQGLHTFESLIIEEAFDRLYKDSKLEKKVSDENS